MIVREIKIEKNSIVPLVEQLSAQLKGMIISGRLPAGHRLPPAVELAKDWGVSYKTAENCLRRMAEEGYIDRSRSKGTFVRYMNGEDGRGMPQSGSNGKVIVLLPLLNKKDYPYTSRVLEGIRSVAAKTGFEITVMGADEFESRGCRWWREVIKEEPAGIIIDKEGLSDASAIRFLEKGALKSVFFNSMVTTHINEIPSLMPDYSNGAFKAVEHLLKLGHLQVAMMMRSRFSSREVYLSDMQKYLGYRVAHERYDHALNDDLVVSRLGNDRGAVRERLEALLRKDPSVTAIFCVDDIIAHNVIEVLKEFGIKVPEEISVVGFNNFDMSMICQPSITTVAVPMVELGEKAMLRLVQAVRGGDEKGQVVLPVELIERESSGRVRQDMLQMACKV